MERRAKFKSSSPNKASLIMVFFSCIASLYVAGRLWEDAENRSILSELVRKNSGKLPKVMTTEDKLLYFGCKDLGRRLVEAEMDLTLAKSQGFLRKKDSSSSGKKLLAVIGVYTGFGGRSSRNSFRSSWIPNGDALRKLEEKGVIVRFIVGRSANRGDSLDRNIDAENASKIDFFILEGHEEASEEMAKKTNFFFSKAVETWDADFYVKVDDNVKLDLDALVDILKIHRGKSGVYMGCMKSGEVVSEQSKMWYEPDWWKFGDEKSYFRHAAGSLFVLSKNLAQYIGINSGSLQTYAHDDISVGSWMIGLETTYIDETRLCCSSSRQASFSFTALFWTSFHISILTTLLTMRKMKFKHPEGVVLLPVELGSRPIC